MYSAIFAHQMNVSDVDVNDSSKTLALTALAESGPHLTRRIRDNMLLLLPFLYTFDKNWLLR